MAIYSGWGFDQSFRAAVDLGNYQYRFVVSGSVEGEVTFATGAAGSVLGVLQNDPRPQEEALVRILGISKVQADAASALVYGGLVKTGSTGLAIGMANPAASTFSAGFCQEAVASGSGAYTEVLLLGFRY